MPSACCGTRSVPATLRQSLRPHGDAQTCQAGCSAGGTGRPFFENSIAASNCSPAVQASDGKRTVRRSCRINSTCFG